MQTFTLKRLTSDENGTFGALINGQPFAVTLERQWLNNKQNVSCIPSGTYMCKRVMSPKFGNTFEVLNVPNRTHILFHKGNLDDDSHGCILIGESYAPINGDSGIASSADGFREFLSLVKDTDVFRLTIEDCF